MVHKNPDTNSDTGERFIVRLDSSISNGNECGNDQWTGYLNSDAGRAHYSTLLAHSISNKSIKLQGTSSTHCIGGAMLIRNAYSKW